MSKILSNEKVQNIIWGTAGLLFVLIIWQLSVAFTTMGRVIPGPFEVFKSLFSYIFKPMGKYTLIGHTLVSLTRVLVGFTLSAVCGIILGIGMGCSEKINAIVRPIFHMVRPIPGVAWIPIAILWLGIGEEAKIFIIFMGGFAQVVLNTMDGARRVDPTLLGAARMLGANKRQEFFKIVLPYSVPYIFAGLQISLSTSWMAVLAAEMVSSYKGSGWIIITGMNNGDTVQILIGMISIGVVGLMIAFIMRIIERLLCSWRIQGQ